MKKILIPDICNNVTTTCNPPKRYCPECSHAWFEGTVKADGKRYSFEFNPQFGIEMKKKEIPPEDHPFWDAWEKWHAKWFKKEKKCH